MESLCLTDVRPPDLVLDPGADLPVRALVDPRKLIQDQLQLVDPRAAVLAFQTTLYHLHLCSVWHWHS
jgi:hypothetical protein